MTNRYSNDVEWIAFCITFTSGEWEIANAVKYPNGKIDTKTMLSHYDRDLIKSVVNIETAKRNLGIA